MIRGIQLVKLVMMGMLLVIKLIELLLQIKIDG